MAYCICPCEVPAGMADTGPKLRVLLQVTGTNVFLSGKGKSIIIHPSTNTPANGKQRNFLFDVPIGDYAVVNGATNLGTLYIYEPPSSFGWRPATGVNNVVIVGDPTTNTDVILGFA